jgi:hypothetical protein
LGATEQMTGNINLLQNYKQFKIKQFVMILNGDKMKILGEGSIVIFSKNIANILFIKNYASNLLSIRKLTNELHCQLIFSSNNVIFQD